MKTYFDISRARACYGILMALIFIFTTACEHPKIFSPTNDTDPLSARSDEAPIIISTKITGGFAGLNQELIVRQGGFIELRNSFPYGGSYSTYLTSEQYAYLHSLFLDNQFSRLNERYITENTADFIYYEITFSQNDLQKTVFADYAAAPPGLKAIIDHLNWHIQQLTQNTLKLHIEASKDSLHVGEPVTLKLIVENISGHNLVLFFKNGQRFNFFAQSAFADNMAGVQKAWSWEQDKVFDQATHTIELPAANTLEYEIEWDGRDYSGTLLSGDILVGSQLVSSPGGTTPMMRIYMGE